MKMLSLEDAVAIAARLHQGQVDKGGEPYILHPLRVMLALEEEDERIVGALHDVVEDAGWPALEEALDGVSSELPPRLRQALDAISKRKGEEWQAYLERVAADDLARRVKIADLRDNADLRRIPDPSPKDVSRTEAYLRALVFLGA